MMQTREEAVLLLQGYCKLNFNKTIPVDVVQLFVTYYWIVEWFEIAGKGTVISDDKRTVTKVSDLRYDYNNTTYGTARIISTDRFECKWTLKIDQCSPYRQITVGISSNNEIDKDYTAWRDSKALLNQYEHYAYNSFSGFKSSKKGAFRYGKQFGSNEDIIEILLSLKKKTVEFTLNGVNQGVAFKDIVCKEDVIYRLAIGFGQPKDSVTLLNFGTYNSECKDK